MAATLGDLPWMCNALDRNYLELIFKFTKNKNWRQSVLVISDTHIESIKTDREWLINVFMQARVRKAPILFIGDVVDSMGSRNDKRRDLSELDPDLMKDGKPYYTCVRDFAVKFLRPFKNSISLICPGNHESAVEKYNEWDYATEIVTKLDSPYIHRGGYAGNVRFSFHGDKAENQQKCRKEMYYHHGTGLKSDAKVTLMVAEHPDCDIFVIGNWHKEKQYPMERRRITPQGKRPSETVEFIQLGSAKDDRQDDYKGYGVEKYHHLNRPSAHWLEFFWDRINTKVQVEARRARAI